MIAGDLPILGDEERRQPSAARPSGEDKAAVLVDDEGRRAG